MILISHSNFLQAPSHSNCHPAALRHFSSNFRKISHFPEIAAKSLFFRQISFQYFLSNVKFDTEPEYRSDFGEQPLKSSILWFSKNRWEISWNAHFQTRKLKSECKFGFSVKFRDSSTTSYTGSLDTELKSRESSVISCLRFRFSY